MRRAHKLLLESGDAAVCSRVRGEGRLHALPPIALALLGQSVARLAVANVRVREGAATEARERGLLSSLALWPPAGAASLLLLIGHPLNLSQRRDHRLAPAQLGRDAVGVVLGAAAHRELQHVRRASRSYPTGHQPPAQGGHTAAVVVVVIRAARWLAAREDAPNLVDASEAGDGHRHVHAGPHVRVSDVTNLVREHRLELGGGQRAAQAGRDGHRRVGGAKASREGVQLVGGDLKDVRRRLEAGAPRNVGR